MKFTANIKIEIALEENSNRQCDSTTEQIKEVISQKTGLKLNMFYVDYCEIENLEIS